MQPLFTIPPSNGRSYLTAGSELREKNRDWDTRPNFRVPDPDGLHYVTGGSHLRTQAKRITLVDDSPAVGSFELPPLAPEEALYQFPQEDGQKYVIDGGVLRLHR